MTYPISKSSNGLYLYLSEWNGSFLAFTTRNPFIKENDTHIVCVDAEVVDTRKQAIEWFQRSTKGVAYAESPNSLHSVDN